MHKKSTLTAEITIYYNADCPKGKKVLAFAQTVSNDVMSFEYSKSHKTPTQWREILTKLGARPKDLLDRSLPYYQEHLKGREFVDEDWLNVLINNPNLMRSPIAMRGGKAIILDNPTDIYKI